MGDWFARGRAPLRLYIETGSGRATAAIVVIELLVAIVWGPYGGSLVDRWDLRRTVILTNVLQAICLVPLLAVTVDRASAFIVAAVQGLLREVRTTRRRLQVGAAHRARGATGPQRTLGERRRRLAVRLHRGSPIGGLAVAAGGLPLVVIVDGATFLAVAVATWLVRTPTPSLHDDTSADEGVGARSGWRRIRQHLLVGYLTVQTMASWTFAMFPVLFIAASSSMCCAVMKRPGLIRGMAAFGGLTAVPRRATREERRPDAADDVGYTGLGLVAFVFVNVSSVSTSLWLFLGLFVPAASRT